MSMLGCFYQLHITVKCSTANSKKNTNLEKTFEFLKFACCKPDVKGLFSLFFFPDNKLPLFKFWNDESVGAVK